VKSKDQKRDDGVNLIAYAIRLAHRKFSTVANAPNWKQFSLNFSSTPNPNKAKSYFTGSSESNSRKSLSLKPLDRKSASQSCFEVIKLTSTTPSTLKITGQIN